MITARPIRAGAEVSKKLQERLEATEFNSKENNAVPQKAT